MAINGLGSQGFVAPYQIQLEDGTLIYAPADDNACVREAHSTSN